MGARDANLLHGKKDLANINGLWTCKVEALQGAKWKHQLTRMRVGYITKLRGAAIYSSLDGEWITMFKLSFDFLLLQAPRNYLLPKTLSQQWSVRHRQGEHGRNEGGNIPEASSSGSALPADDNPVPLMFNWGAQYMEETPAMVEAKEINML